MPRLATSLYGARAANGVVSSLLKSGNQLNVLFSATLTVRPYNFYTILGSTADTDRDGKGVGGHES